MPKAKGETDEQWMQRLRDYRRDHMMERTRAAVCFVNSRNGESNKTRMNAFLDIFHPEIKPHSLQHIQLVNGAE